MSDVQYGIIQYTVYSQKYESYRWWMTYHEVTNFLDVEWHDVYRKVTNFPEVG
jgi:hypothetical protein